MSTKNTSLYYLNKLVSSLIQDSIFNCELTFLLLLMEFPKPDFQLGHKIAIQVRPRIDKSNLFSTTISSNWYMLPKKLLQLKLRLTLVNDYLKLHVTFWIFYTMVCVWNHDRKKLYWWLRCSWIYHEFYVFTFTT